MWKYRYNIYIIYVLRYKIYNILLKDLNKFYKIRYL